MEHEAFPTTAWTAESFWSELAGVPDTRYYVVAVADATVLGYAGLALSPPDADVQTLAVAERARGAGVGALLLQQLLDEAAVRGCRRVLLEVAADNHRAQHLYERHGFTVTSRRRQYYGPGRDALVMTLRLGPRADPPAAATDLRAGAP
jgi:ribosomal-protein-alanine N-acetyltransferase